MDGKRRERDRERERERERVSARDGSRKRIAFSVDFLYAPTLRPSTARSPVTPPISLFLPPLFGPMKILLDGGMTRNRRV